MIHYKLASAPFFLQACQNVDMPGGMLRCSCPLTSSFPMNDSKRCKGFSPAALKGVVRIVLLDRVNDQPLPHWKNFLIDRKDMLWSSVD